MSYPPIPAQRLGLRIGLITRLQTVNPYKINTTGLATS